MGGLLTHALIAVICLFMVYRLHSKWSNGLSIFIGNFAPDVIKFFISALFEKSISILSIENTSLYKYLGSMVSDPTNWLTLGFFFLGIGLLLYHFKYVKKLKMEEYDELFIFFLIGVFIHIAIDILVLESSPWI